MTPPRAIIAITCIVIGGLTSMPALAQPPARDAARPAPRDAAKPAPSGTATIDGVIVTDDSDARPLRRVRVAIVTSDRQVGRTTVTDDEGRFRFSGLPAGRFMLSASKQGYVTTSYGARRPNRPGTAVVLADGQRMTGLTMRLSRGSVISGVIVDQNGDPFAGGTVNAMRNAYSGSGRTLVPAASAQTDDRGHYRIWGLPAGDYVVSTSSGSSPIRDIEIARLTDADIKRALSEVAGGSSQAGGTSTAPSDNEPRSRTVGYAPVFYPGTPVASQAIPIKLGVAEERTGVDFPLSLVPTAKVEGHVVVPEGVNPRTLAMQMIGSNPQGMILDLFRRGSVAADGSFSFAGVTPGPYAIVVQAMPGPPPAPPGGRPGPAAGPPRQPTHWARADVVIEGQDISGVSLTLQPGMVVSGKVQLEGTNAQPPDLSRLRINLLPVQASGEVSLGQMQIQPDATGAFSISGVTPGRYRLMAGIPSPRPDTVGWQLKSAVVLGQDTLDVPVDLREGTDSAVITFTDRVTELNGTIQDASGQPAPEYTVVVFARDKSLWTAQSRRIRTVRPAADGKFVMPNMPPGDYLMTAVTDLEPGEQSDPAFLELLSRSAIAVTIGEGEKKTQDLRLAAQTP